MMASCRSDGALLPHPSLMKTGLEMMRPPTHMMAHGSKSGMFKVKTMGRNGSLAI